jgi:hypothetical protein
MINKVVDEFEGGIHFVEIDIETDPEIAEAAGARDSLSRSLASVAVFH